jgi:hypothetical protein
LAPGAENLPTLFPPADDAALVGTTEPPETRSRAAAVSPDWHGHRLERGA